jgi:hypothetical protein
LNSTCEFDEFQCKSGKKQCLDISKVCDGKSDCLEVI